MNVGINNNLNLNSLMLLRVLSIIYLMSDIMWIMVFFPIQVFGGLKYLSIYLSVYQSITAVTISAVIFILVGMLGKLKGVLWLTLLMAITRYVVVSWAYQVILPLVQGSVYIYPPQQFLYIITVLVIPVLGSLGMIYFSFKVIQSKQ